MQLVRYVFVEPNMRQNEFQRNKFIKTLVFRCKEAEESQEVANKSSNSHMEKLRVIARMTRSVYDKRHHFSN